MAAYDSLVSALNSALDELATDLTALRDEVAGTDADVAAKFGPLIERAQRMGQDPADPIPGQPVEVPTDAPEGDGTGPTFPGDAGFSTSPDTDGTGPA